MLWGFCNQGRRYATLARELGLQVAHLDHRLVGHQRPRPHRRLLSRGPNRVWSGAGAVAPDRAGQPTGPGLLPQRLACTCACGRRIRVARSVLELAPILCAACAQSFRPEDDQEV